MIPLNCNLWPILGLLVIYCCRIVISDWEFAVTNEEKIIFYDANWQYVGSFEHFHFKDIQAIAHDDITDTIFFNDKLHQNGSIFSLRLNNDTLKTAYFDKLIHKSTDELIGGIAFDPLKRMLYWTDSRNQKIYRMPLGFSSEIVPENVSVWRDIGGNSKPCGIAIDVCRRKIYWTTTNGENSTIHSSSMDGHDAKVIIKGDTILGLTVDQYSKRLYWVDDLQGIDYKVGSSMLDGTDETIVVKDVSNEPLNLAVDRNFIYWTDSTYKTIWKMPKNANESTRPEKIKQDFNSPHDIIFRQNLISSNETSADCKAVFAKMNEIEKNTTSTTTTETPKTTHCPSMVKPNLLCHNYCLVGTCQEVSGKPKCACPDGYTGDRCEQDQCFEYCLNGRCLFEKETIQPVCKTKICERFCAAKDKQGSHELVTLCGCGISSDNITQLPLSQNIDENINLTCKNITTIMVGSVVVISLVLVLLIVVCLRRFYKPIRPRIKKTFVVRNKMDSKNKTPLTCRPVTEQCEITIEDCCNMNICDTPCFDPETMHEEMKKERNRKADKYNLLSNMDGDLY